MNEPLEPTTALRRALPPRQGLIFPPDQANCPTGDRRGVVFTKDWVVDLVLDLAGYSEETDLAATRAVEPAAGDGAFLAKMAERLVTSSRKHGRAITDCLEALVAYELDQSSAEQAGERVRRVLHGLGVESEMVELLVASWIRAGDYLFEVFTLPPADFVVGNPPYIRLEHIPPQVASAYRDSYQTMTGRADLYIAFFEAALGQLTEAGTCAFICADRWMLNQYGAKLRQLVTHSFAVDTVVEMHNAEAFHEDVSAYPAITIIRKQEQHQTLVATVRSSAEEQDGRAIARKFHQFREGGARVEADRLDLSLVHTWFQGSDPWPCSSPGRLALLRRLEERFAPLDSPDHRIKIGIGVATGLDEVFITKDASLVEQSRLLPLAMARDTFSGHLQWSGHYLVNPWQEEGLVNLAEYPRLRQYFEKHEAPIRRRNTAQKNRYGWYRTIDRVAHSLTPKQKLYVPDIKDAFNPVLDPGGTYPHHNLYFIESDLWDLELLGGILLSSLGQLFIEAYGVRMRGGYLRFQAQYLRRICVPLAHAIPLEVRNALVAAFRGRNRQLATDAAVAIYGIRAGELEAALGH